MHYPKDMTKSRKSLCVHCNQNNLPFYDSKDRIHEYYNRELLASDDIKMFFKEINEFNNKQEHAIDNVDEDFDISPLINCKYVDINSLKLQKVNSKSFFLLYHNIGSLEKNKDELEATLSILDFKFDVIGISVTKIKAQSPPKFDLGICGYKHYSTPTEANKDGVMYILDKHDTIPRKDLEKITYKPHVLESTFVELVVPNKKNILLGCIYRHPSMNLKDFNDEHLSSLLEKFSDKKHTFLFGDFNVDLMKTDEDSKTDYFDMMTSAQFVPHIIHPTRITPHSKTLIDNIFSNTPNFSEGMSGNLTVALSDHLAQFLIIPLDTYLKPAKIEKFKRDTKKFERENFWLDLLEIDWLEIIHLEKEDPNFSFQQYFQTINSLIDKYMPLKKITNKEIKHQAKPWITKEILMAICDRDFLYKKYIRAKIPESKAEYGKQYKTLRNKITEQIKQSKMKYFQDFFTKHANNIKSTWKGIKSIICVKSNIKSQPNSLLIKNKLISELYCYIGFRQ